MSIENLNLNLNPKVTMQNENVAIIRESFITKIVCGKKSNEIKVTTTSGTWLYEGTTRNDFHAIITAPSVSKFYTNNIRNNKNFTAVEC